LWFSTAALGAALGQETISFNRDIRPILSDNCFFCHGPDTNKREAGLRLDTLEGLHGTETSTETSTGGNSSRQARAGVLVAGKPQESLLIERIETQDAELHMPPLESGKKLTAEQIELLKRWISQGGQYEGHWAFEPRKSSGISGDEPVRDRIDALISGELTKHGLKAGAKADRVTLLRRLYFDLTGLPPTQAQVQEYLQDESPEAYERLVDRLLASSHFGERMAMWWMDLVRYADSVGYHGDQEMSVSPFREYVIESFNANKPFDTFTIEQLAGDLLPSPSLEQRIASGYNRLGMMSAEGGVQDREYLAKYMSERVRNASGTWLGITLGCAECHDHKFDPLSAKDFYSFGAFFADIKERGLYSGANADGNWGPYVKVPSR
jgi:cytochrome c553